MRGFGVLTPQMFTWYVVKDASAELWFGLLVDAEVVLLKMLFPPPPSVLDNGENGELTATGVTPLCIAFGLILELNILASSFPG